MISRKYFPLLKTMTYLDNAATSQTPKPVLDSMRAYYTEYRASVHRGVCSLSERATDEFEAARTTAARFINAQPDEVIFTAGTTDSINKIARMLAGTLQPGDELVVTELEHHSNLVPWQTLAKERGLLLKTIPILDDGTLDMHAAERIITAKTKVLACAHASNVLGTVVDVKALAGIARARGALVVIDAAQSAPHGLVDVKNMDADFLACSGHKMLGPTGTGLLFGRKELLEKFPPAHQGGGMISGATPTDATFIDSPHKHEAGTPNIAGVIGLRAALDMLAPEKENIYAHGQTLVKHFFKHSPTDFIVYGGKKRLPIFSGNLGHVHCHDIASLLSQKNICVRAGNHCAIPLMNKYAVTGSVRASAYLYNTKADIDAFFAGLDEARRLL